MSKKITVITPSFNSGKYIEQAIQSVLAQNYPDFEHIIVDGGSTDGTIEILKKYPHLKWVSESDRGQSHAMNKGFGMATGEIIVYLNADDFFEIGAFNTAVKYLNKEKDIYFVVGECNVLDDDNNLLPGHNNPKVTLYEMLQWWKYIFPQNPSSYFYYKDVQDKLRGFDEQKHYTMDYDFLLRASINYKIYKINETLGNYRYIKGTKTYESCKTGHSTTQLEFAKSFWKYLSPTEMISINLSWFYKMLRCSNLLYIIHPKTIIYKIRLRLFKRYYER